MTGEFRPSIIAAPCSRAEKHHKGTTMPETPATKWDPPVSSFTLHDRVMSVKMLVAEASRRDLAMLQELISGVERLAAAAEAKGLRASPVLAPMYPEQPMPKYSHARCTAHWRTIMQRLCSTLCLETQSVDTVLQQVEGIPSFLPWNGDTSLRLSQNVLQIVRQEVQQDSGPNNQDLLDSVMDDLTVRLTIFGRRDYRGTVEFVNAPIRASIEILRRLEEAVSDMQDGSTAPRRYTRRLTRLIQRLTQLVLPN